MNPDEAIITLHDINKSFVQSYGKQTVLKNINFSLYPGEMVAILGPSGSGKSTLLNILGLLLSSDNGKYMIENHEVSKENLTNQAEIRLHKISFVFQSFHLIEHKNVKDNVILPLKYFGVLTRNERNQKARMVLDDLGLGHRIKSPVSTLSGGEKQRVALARALVTSPTLMLCDEPTGSLDAERSNEVIKILRESTKGARATVIVTHDLEVANHCDRVFLIRDGFLEEKVSAQSSVAADKRNSPNKSIRNSEQYSDLNLNNRKKFIPWIKTSFLEGVDGTLNRIRRNLFTVLGVALGVASLVLTVGLTATISHQISSAFNVFLSKQMVLTQTSDTPLTPNQAIELSKSAGFRNLESLNGVQETSVIQIAALQSAVSLRPRTDLEQSSNAVSDILGVTPSFFRAQEQLLLQGVEISENHLENQEKVAIVSESLLNDLGIHWSSGLTIYIGESQFNVIGVVSDQPQESEISGRVYIPLGVVPSGGSLDKTRVLIVTDSGAANQVGREAGVTLDPAQPASFAAGIVPEPDSLRDSVSESQKALLLTLSGVTLIIAAVGITNTFLVAVMERRKEIGLRKALGMRPAGIVLQFFVESLFTSAAGAFIGIVIAVNGITIISLYNNWIPVVEPGILVFGLGSGLLVGGIAGLYPALKASTVDTTEALAGN